MGKFSDPLAVVFADLAAMTRGQSALDVGCGPGALTAELDRRLGSAAIAAVDPSASFVAAARDRLPGVDVRQAAAEHLPFDDNIFDHVLAQLVVHFMADPAAGLGEMRRVARPGGTVAACVWDFAGERAPLSVFWQAAQDLDPAAPAESGRTGTRQGQLTEIFTRAGLSQVSESALRVSAGYASFEQWWDPYTLGVGPAGSYVRAQTPEQRERLREHCRELLPAGPILREAFAWAATGRA